MYGVFSYTFTIKINQMQVNIPYMDPMGIEFHIMSLKNTNGVFPMRIEQLLVGTGTRSPLVTTLSRDTVGGNPKQPPGMVLKPGK